LSSSPNGAEEHDADVSGLLAAFKDGKNSRVPVWFASDEHLWLTAAKRSFREFYLNPRVQLDVQLLGQKWMLDNVTHDRASGYPDIWRVSPRDWMHENAFFGAGITYQENDYAWGNPVELDKGELLRSIEEMDAGERVRASLLWRLYVAMKEVAAGMRFEGRPVEVTTPGQGTDGILTKTCEVRGSERFCMDICDDPDYARRLLGAVTRQTIARIKFWLAQDGIAESALPRASGFFFCDDSLQMISRDVYEAFVLPCHEALCSALTTGKRAIHLCGHATQHYRSLYDKAGITHIDGPGVFADHGRYMAEMPGLSFAAQMHSTCLNTGTDAEIGEMLKGLMTDGAKRAGRFEVVGFINGETPIEKIRTAYQMGREYGPIGAW